MPPAIITPPKKLRIAIIIDSLAAGGAERQATIIAKALSDKGHAIDIISFAPHNDYQLFLANCPVKRICISNRSMFKIQKIISLKKHLLISNYDIVHAFKGAPNVISGIAGRLARCPVIFFGYRSQLPEPCSLYIFTRLLSSIAKGWIVNSSYVKNHVVSYFKINPALIYIVPNAIIPQSYHSNMEVSQAKAALGIDSSTPTITMVANLRKIKNHIMLLRAAAQLISKYKTILFILAGSGEELQPLTQVADDLHISEHVRFMGHFDDIPLLLRATDIAVLTSTCEGLPNALIEASAAGIPCISTDNGGANDVILDGKTGYIIPQNDHVALAYKINYLLDNPNVLKQFGDAARYYALNQFDVNHVTERLLDIYYCHLSSERIFQDNSTHIS